MYLNLIISQTAHGNFLTNISLILSGEDHKFKTQMLKTPAAEQKYNVPDTVKQSIQISDPSKLHPETIFHDWDYRRGIITQTAIKRMSENLEIDSIVSSDDSDSPPKKRKVTKELPCINQKEKKIQRLSPLALRRAYLPRNPTNTSAAHRAAAAAAAQAQKKPPVPPNKFKEEPKTYGTTDRHSRVTLTRFKPGFEWETECELAQAFRRPPRLFKEDTPFYPWLPRPEPLVNFHLNFKF